MIRYIAARLLGAVPVLLIATGLTFFMVHLLPGDLVVTRLGAQATPGDVARLRATLGLDDPLIVQYARWLGGLVTGDPGRSLTADLPVSDQFFRRLPVTAELAILGILLSIVIGVPLGVVSAVQQGRLIDHVVRIFAVLGQAVPGFWLGVLSLTMLSIYFSWVPPLTYRSVIDDPWYNVQQFALPAVITGYALSATVMRLTRSAMLEVLNQEYIRTARAKGLGNRVVMYRHALRNALIPIVTILGAQVGTLLGGAIIVESVFSLSGVGRLTFQAVNDRDYTQLQFNVFMFGAAVIVVNLLVDICYSYLDPRIRSTA